MKNLIQLFFWSCIFSTSQLAAQNAEVPFADFYVSTVGNDKWSGKLTELKLKECNINRNLYFDVNLADHGKSAVSYYRTRGADANSISAAPLFSDVKNGDFQLDENSPAHQLGLKDIDM